MELIEILNGSLKTGFINQSFESQKLYRPELLSNDPRNGQKVLTSILRNLENCDEFWFSVAFITTSGVATLINTLIDLEAKGIKGKILASQYLNFTQPEALRRILKFKNIELRIATKGDFHSKGYLFRKGIMYNLIIGSSNLTQGALSTNKEWNLKVCATLDSELITNTTKEFKEEFESGLRVTEDFIKNYNDLYLSQKQAYIRLDGITKSRGQKVVPNTMQTEALKNIENLRNEGKNKALLISATGTGKTYLSAFDVERFNPRKFLFVVHRRTIAIDAMNTFRSLLGNDKNFGLYSGNEKEINADFLFSTVQTISKEDHLNRFQKEHFDYIVIDETHRAGADSYRKILNYFNPRFLLGMTATPERTDGLDIFQLFDHNIAYEIRLHKAMEEDMLSPFHYYGITDLTINGEEIDDKTEFNLLTSQERIDRIIEKAKLYGTDDGSIRGLIFCSKVEESKSLSKEFNKKGFRTTSLTGENSEEERGLAIQKLESDDPVIKLDYIFSVDVFNEGIDIPAVNQIIMLRPTQSAIIFVQQLGRGLRKTDGKSYLTVIDFIGNYSNNYLVPIALYGDTSYNKDSLRKLVVSGSRLVPGSSTVNFDKIAKEKIFEAIASANMQLKKDLKKDYDLLKFKLGRVPKMNDFLEHGSRDPQLYVDYSKSYFNFVEEQEDYLKDKLTEHQKNLLELFSQEINNSKRVEESWMLRELISNGKSKINSFKDSLLKTFGYTPNETTIKSAINNLNFAFVTKQNEGKLRPVQEILDIKMVKRENQFLVPLPDFTRNLENQIFKDFLLDSTEYSIRMFSRLYNKTSYKLGFVLYRKYSRKDVFRILNWEQNPLAQNVGGYMISPNKEDCAIFVNYHKDEDISESTKYEDEFLSPTEFQWMSKSNRTLNSPEIQLIKDQARNGIRLPLFIKKSNDEGSEFYYMGELSPIKNSYEQTRLPNGKGKDVSVVKLLFKLNPPVTDEIYDYLTSIN